MNHCLLKMTKTFNLCFQSLSLSLPFERMQREIRDFGFVCRFWLFLKNEREGERRIGMLFEGGFFALLNFSFLSRRKLPLLYAPYGCFFQGIFSQSQHSIACLWYFIYGHYWFVEKSCLYIYRHTHIYIYIYVNKKIYIIYIYI